MTNVYVPDEQETEYKGFHYWTFEGTYYFRDIGTLPSNMNSEESVRACIDVISENKKLQSAIADKDTEITRLRSLLKEVKEDAECLIPLTVCGAGLHNPKQSVCDTCPYIDDCRITKHRALMEKLKQEGV